MPIPPFIKRVVCLCNSTPAVKEDDEDVEETREEPSKRQNSYATETAIPVAMTAVVTFASEDPEISAEGEVVVEQSSNVWASGGKGPVEQAPVSISVESFGESGAFPRIIEEGEEMQVLEDGKNDEQVAKEVVEEAVEEGKDASVPEMEEPAAREQEAMEESQEQPDEGKQIETEDAEEPEQAAEEEEKKMETDPASASLPKPQASLPKPPASLSKPPASLEQTPASLPKPPASLPEPPAVVPKETPAKVEPKKMPETVYISRHAVGKRIHFHGSKTCNKKTLKEYTLEKALAKKLVPCPKCLPEFAQ
mmetsp:Transcript_9217/g.15796  ORF Transcript_9217/g.15796 Transcript_9217/m.15796 type:complete len:308 (-) Transcript_9217:1343-2266(-)|eukprot:CAMPEP_0196656696 /NCGR_PEP_ID=MMETSP1086-20130531/19381_1 /TAXON_ID=77921 /ORGANISM="Cyanoptyche  gloeocystis , Strain SAG4.97" /LENGTH=307 /DNA_ID=CAMNT_0041989545 /DNA_START=57 /DNA_END=980 /DNA_ORIENTATION=+